MDPHQVAFLTTGRDGIRFADPLYVQPFAPHFGKFRHGSYVFGDIIGGMRGDESAVSPHRIVGTTGGQPRILYLVAGIQEQFLGERFEDALHQIIPPILSIHASDVPVMKIAEQDLAASKAEIQRGIQLLPSSAINDRRGLIGIRLRVDVPDANDVVPPSVGSPGVETLKFLLKVNRRRVDSFLALIVDDSGCVPKSRPESVEFDAGHIECHRRQVPLEGQSPFL